MADRIGTRYGLGLVVLSLLLLGLAGSAWAASLSSSASTAEPGDSLLVSGSGFEPQLEVRICFDPGSYRCANLGTATSGADGSFVKSVKVKAVETSGSYVIRACQIVNGDPLCASTSIFVVVPDPTTTTTLAPSTTTTAIPTTTAPTLPTTTSSTTTLPLPATTSSTTTLPFPIPTPPTTTTFPSPIPTSPTTTLPSPTTTTVATTTTLGSSGDTTAPTTPGASDAEPAAADASTTTTLPTTTQSPSEEGESETPEVEVLAGTLDNDESPSLDAQVAQSESADSPDTGSGFPIEIPLIAMAMGLLGYVIWYIVKEVRR